MTSQEEEEARRIEKEDRSARQGRRLDELRSVYNALDYTIQDRTLRLAIENAIWS